ncbi:hypothetical protein [Aliikangiella sp. IMCC44359]|uniref:hypothetical protein n=1 Tax=Aliikangiella sp. IMCC44359 TaxID=3459125 RepID=UPI00403AB2C9
MRFILLLCLTVFSLYTNADTADKNTIKTLIECSEITDNKQRLVCFDRQLLQIKNNAKTNNKLVNTSQEELFGKQKPEESAPKSLESHIKGVFKGWVKGKIITLENGQKWKVISQTKGYTKLTNPKVTISKGVLNSYDMRVEGFISKAKVKRVK